MLLRPAQCTERMDSFQTLPPCYDKERMMKVDLPVSTGVGAQLFAAAQNSRMIFFTGLPASGKSFLLRQQTLLAAKAQRRVTILRWDSGLAAFQTAAILAKYPEIQSGSHPIIRRAMGHWGRQAVARWQSDYPDPREILICEVPIIGNRFSELVRPYQDATELALSAETTAFFYPVPTNELREKLEQIRIASFANPGHPDEANDAPPSTMEYAWRVTVTRAIDLGLIEARGHSSETPYDAAIYRLFFDHLLQHRNANALSIDRLFPIKTSAHNLAADVMELTASPKEVAEAFEAVENSMSAHEIAQAVDEWHLV